MIGRVRAICLATAILGSMYAVPPAEAGERLLVTDVVGPPKNVRAGDFGIARAKCPRGYHVISAGLQLGAIEPVSDFRASARVWKSDGFNPEGNFTAFRHRVQVTCISGRSGVSVRSVRSGRRASSAVAGSTGSSTGPGYVQEARRAYAKGIVESAS